MPLAEALRVFGPVVDYDDPQASAAKNHAGETLLAELMLIARPLGASMGFTRSDAEDVAHSVLVSLLKDPNPLESTATGQDAENVARAYLRSAVRHKFISKRRRLKQHALVSLDDPGVRDIPMRGDGAALELATDVDAAHELILNQIVPKAAEAMSRKVAATFSEGIRELCAIRDGTTTVEEIMIASERSRAAVDQRLSRIVKTLGAVVDDHAKREGLPIGEAAFLRVAVDRLRPRNNKRARPDASS